MRPLVLGLAALLAIAPAQGADNALARLDAYLAASGQTRTYAQLSPVERARLWQSEGFRRFLAAGKRPVRVVHLVITASEMQANRPWVVRVPRR